MRIAILLGHAAATGQATSTARQFGAATRRTVQRELCRSSIRAEPLLLSMPPQLALLLLLLAGAARTPCHALPSLRALALLNTENDDAQTAGLVEVDARTGSVRAIGFNFSWSTQAATSLDCATAFAPASAPASARWMSVVGAGPSIAQVDALSGSLLGMSAPLAPPYVVASVSYDEGTGLLVAVAQSLRGSVDLVSINATSGAVVVISRALAGMPFPQPCQSALSLATGTLYTVSDDTDNDDAAQAVEAYSISSGALLHSVPWPAPSAGAVGRPIVVPAAHAGGDDTLVLIWSAPPSATPARGIRFLQLELANATQRILAELPASFSGLVIDIGGQSPQSPPRAADGSFSIVAFGFDNPTDSAYLVQVGSVRSGCAHSAGGQLANVTLTPVLSSAFLWSPAIVDV